MLDTYHKFSVEARFRDSSHDKENKNDRERKKGGPCGDSLFI